MSEAEMRVVKSLDIVNDYIEKLEQENKQLKSILTELEEWLKEEIEHNVDGIKSFSGYQCKETLDKIQELKEKYK